MDLLVKNNHLFIKDSKFKCAVGKNGLTENKIEGDFCTPIGIFHFDKIYYRQDRLGKIDFHINSSIIKLNDGWCDDKDSEMYNQYIQFPFNNSAEHLYRDDHIYDIVCIINYNTSPIIAGKGSAIFLHISTPNFNGTAGCVALDKEVLIKISQNITERTLIKIEP